MKDTKIKNDILRDICFKIYTIRKKHLGAEALSNELKKIDNFFETNDNGAKGPKI
jgi:hypothetical protein